MKYHNRFVFSLKKIFHYEFWPFRILYFIPFLYGIYLIIKSRSVTYFTAVNPLMRFSGAFGTSKFDYLKYFPKRLIPKSCLIDKKMTATILQEKISANKLNFPLIIKPNDAERGKGVEQINSFEELKKYLKTTTFSKILLQEFIDYEIEIGILFFQFPDSQKKKISSIGGKIFCEITGDGKSTLEDLVKKNIRIRHRQKQLKERFNKEWDTIIPLNKKIKIEPIGNHNRGTEFVDRNKYIDKKTLKTVSKWASYLPDFYYGRFDIKLKNWESFHTGKDIKILEINGVNSEPIHIYDKKCTLWQAYKSIFYHMKIIYQISRINRKNGVATTSFRTFWKGLMEVH